MLGKVEGSKKRGRPRMRQIDSIKEFMGMSLQELKGAVEDRTAHVTHSQHCQELELIQKHTTDTYNLIKICSALRVSDYV